MKKAVIINDTSYDLHLGCELVVDNLKNLLHKNYIELIGSSKVGNCWYKDKSFLKLIKVADILIVNGEGTIHDNNLDGLWLLKVGKYAKKNNKKSVLINCTYQNNSKSWKKYLSDFDIISVRETNSYEELKKININSKVVPDLSFYSNFNLKKSNNKNGKIIFGDSVKIETSNKFLNFSRRYPNSVFISIFKKIKLNYSFTSFTSLIKYIKNFLIYYLNMLSFKLFEKSFKNSYQLRYYGFKSLNDYLKKQLNSKILITGRFHSVCIAINIYMPFLAINSNSYKIEGLLNDVGLRSRLIRNEENILNEIMFKSHFSEKEKIKINNYLNNSRIKINNLFFEIANL